jgi:Superinfection immunity protein/Short C-terminal domain
MPTIFFLFFPFGFLGSLTGGVLLIITCFYFFPTIIALGRGKSNAGAILVLNLFLGWTFIGWIVALVWAISSDAQPQQVIIHNNVEPDKKYATSGARPVSASSQPERPGSAVYSQQDRINQLRQLKELLDAGVLTQAEFEQQKAQILGA